jgi:hypothetical protein
LSAGLAQQAGVEQCLESHPVQQQHDFAPATPMPAEGVGRLCQARIIPSTMAAAFFTKRDIIWLVAPERQCSYPIF